MPQVRATISLPYVLKLLPGVYPTSRDGRGVQVEQPTLLPDVSPKTRLSTIVDQPDAKGPDEQSRLKDRQADDLLIRANRLIRCYRAITQEAVVTELSRAEASPFRFRVISPCDDPSAWEVDLVFEATPPRIPWQTMSRITGRVHALLASGDEPEVADLFLLDAERAAHEARFREAVLFCWSTIDSTFNRKYDELVNAKLAGERAEAREFFKGVDFGLKKKMSAALFLVGGRSLFREPGDLWQRLSNSYKKRNGIIHRGEGADEDDARQALEVARSVVDLMSGL